MIQYAKPKIKSPETYAAPPVNSAPQGIANDSFDQFIARSDLAEIRDLLRKASNHPAAHRHERALLESPFRSNGRVMLARLARARICETFIATVTERGLMGRQRSVLLKNLRLFGSKFIEEDHLWFHYSKLWARIEPFYQGEKLVLVGTAVRYTRKNGTPDFTVALEYVTKLWMPTKNAAPTDNQASLTVPLCRVSEATPTI